MVMLMSASGWSQDKRTEMEELVEAAAANNGKAQYLMGMRYLNGDGVRRNYLMATHWFGQAHYNGYDKGMRKLKKLVQKKGDDGNYPDFRYVLEGFAQGFVKNDTARTGELFDIAYRQSGLLEYKVMGMFFSDPKKVNVRPEEMKELKEKILEDDPLSQSAIGEGWLDAGKDTLQALALLQKSVDAGFMHSHNALGRFYLLSEEPYYNADKAVYHLLEAERHKILTYSNHHWLIFCYEHALGGLIKDDHRVAALRTAQEEWRDAFHEFLEYILEDEWF